MFGDTTFQLLQLSNFILQKENGVDILSIMAWLWHPRGPCLVLGRPGWGNSRSFLLL